MHLSQPQATAAVAGLVLVASYALRRLPPTAPLWAKVPDGWRWLVPLVLASLTAFGEALQSGRGWDGALQVGLTAVLAAIGVHKVASDAPGPYNSKPQEVPK